jgi:hypothetical protein
MKLNEREKGSNSKPNINTTKSNYKNRPICAFVCGVGPSTVG